MLLRHTFGLSVEADAIEAAVGKVLDAGVRTKDLGGEAACTQMGAAVLEALP